MQSKMAVKTSDWTLSRSEWFYFSALILTIKPLISIHPLVGTAIWLIFVAVYFFTGPIYRCFLFLMGFVVFYQQSVWYILNDVPLTIYEIEFVHFKPVEIILGLFFIRAIFLGFKTIKLPKGVFCIMGLWMFSIVTGVIISLYNRNKIYDMFIFSEFRTLCWSYLVLILFFYFAKDKTHWVVRQFIILVLAKCLITLPDYLGWASILWPGSIANYSGSISAFFGGDPDVMVIVLGFCLSFSLIVLPRMESENSSLFTQKDSIFLNFTFFSAILLSLRRGGIMAVGIAIGLLMLFAQFRVKLAFFTLLLVMIAYMALDITGDFKTLPGPVYAMTDRFTGKGQAAKSNMGHVLDIKDGIREVSQYLWLGKGVGARMLSFRAAEVHGAEVHDSILIHQNVLHTWLKFGLVGVIIYFLTFFVPLLTILKYRGKYLGTDVAIMLGAGSFLIAKLLWAFLTPPFFQTFRTNFLVFMAIFLLYASIDKVCSHRSKSNTPIL